METVYQCGLCGTVWIKPELALACEALHEKALHNLLFKFRKNEVYPSVILISTSNKRWRVYRQQGEEDRVVSESKLFHPEFTSGRILTPRES